MTREGYECYKMYLALQRHFSTSYDFHKYNGKVNASTESYQKRNDMFSFEKLSRVVLPEDRLDFFICHFLDNPKCWIRSMSKSNYEIYKAKMKNFPNKFKEDLEYISTYNPSELMEVKNEIPLIHKLFINKKIDVESIIAIDKFFPFTDRHDENVKLPIVWPDHIDMLKNYRPFFQPKVSDIQKDVMKSILLG